MTTTTEYDVRAQAWVRAKFPGARPDPGSVEFSSDCAAYASGGWASVDVAWREGGEIRTRELKADAWQYDWTTVIRELAPGGRHPLLPPRRVVELCP